MLLASVQRLNPSKHVSIILSNKWFFCVWDELESIWYFLVYLVRKDKREKTTDTN